MRLSWPKPNDKKRTLQLRSSEKSLTVRQSDHIRLINASFWDIQLHYYLASASGLHGMTSSSHVRVHTQHSLGTISADQGFLAPPALPATLSWSPVELDSNDKDLIEYCEYRIKNRNLSEGLDSYDD
jgi:hypothetical protein